MKSNLYAILLSAFLYLALSCQTVMAQEKGSPLAARNFAVDGQYVNPGSEDHLQWWIDAKFGMFIHWGLYAIPAGTWKNSVHEEGYSEWIMFEEQIPVREYECLTEEFNPVEFDAKRWVKLAKAAGMKYMIITAKHHDGFSMFDSEISDYNIVNRTPFKRDVIRELMEACKNEGIKFGCYYSIDRDWHHPLCGSNRWDEDNNWDYPDKDLKDFDTYLYEYALPQVRELLTNYDLDLIWFDGVWMKSDDQVHELYKMIKSIRPNCLVNSRIKAYYAEEALPLVDCDYLSMNDNQIAEEFLDVGWENPGTMNTSYGYNKNDHNWHPTKRLIYNLVDIVSKEGNYLLNVGPTELGVIPEASTERLLEMGKWLEINGEAIYHTRHWDVYGEGPIYERQLQAKEELEDDIDDEPLEELIDFTSRDMRFTKNGNKLYVICFEWPDSHVVVKSLPLDSRYEVADVCMMGSEEKITWEQTDEGLVLSSPHKKVDDFAYVYRIILQ